MRPLQRVTDLGVLAIDGPDATTFLQGQATCDTRLLSTTRALLGALCNLQGRMIVSFYVLPAGDGLRLLMPADRVGTVMTHLKKYAVFSKVTLREAAELAVFFSRNTGGEPFTLSQDSDSARLSLRGDRTLSIVPAATTTGSAPDATPDATIATDGNHAWLASSILAGELLVGTAVAERFLPQALNYDVIDGVSFRKGCYTGQEVVARMHFKGRMKERLYVLTSDAGDTPAPGTVIVDAAGNPCGEIVAAAQQDDSCLIGAVVRHDAMLAGSLRLGSPEGLVLQACEMPYSVPN